MLLHVSRIAFAGSSNNINTPLAVRYVRRYWRQKDRPHNRSEISHPYLLPCPWKASCSVLVEREIVAVCQELSGPNPLSTRPSPDSTNQAPYLSSARDYSRRRSPACALNTQTDFTHTTKATGEGGYALGCGGSLDRQVLLREMFCYTQLFVVVDGVCMYGAKLVISAKRDAMNGRLPGVPAPHIWRQIPRAVKNGKIVFAKHKERNSRDHKRC